VELPLLSSVLRPVSYFFAASWISQAIGEKGKKLRCGERLAIVSILIGERVIFFLEK
jgi:hypothetical protein